MSLKIIHINKNHKDDKDETRQFADMLVKKWRERARKKSEQKKSKSNRA